jgi:myo-inositol-1(or 4)-monophosphatase
MKINPEFKKTALLAVKSAGRILEKNFGKKQRIFTKKSEIVEWVTDSDLCSEKTIRKIIKNKFPKHDILGEEGGGKIGGGFSWVIDPLDGTFNYMMGIPLFSVSLALLERGEPILAIVFNPISNELYLAEKGRGAFLNGKRIKVNGVKDLSLVLLVFNKGKDFSGSLKNLIKIAPHIRTLRFWGSANLEICQIAAGKFEGFISAQPIYHDTIIGGYIVEEAGGKITDFKGVKYKNDSDSILITNGNIQDKLLKLINN